MVHPVFEMERVYALPARPSIEFLVRESGEPRWLDAEECRSHRES
jgi:hypothetical protein